MSVSLYTFYHDFVKRASSIKKNVSLSTIWVYDEIFKNTVTCHVRSSSKLVAKWLFTEIQNEDGFVPLQLLPLGTFDIQDTQMILQVVYDSIKSYFQEEENEARKANIRMKKLYAQFLENLKDDEEGTRSSFAGDTFYCGIAKNDVLELDLPLLRNLHTVRISSDICDKNLTITSIIKEIVLRLPKYNQSVPKKIEDTVNYIQHRVNRFLLILDSIDSVDPNLIHCLVYILHKLKSDHNVETALVCGLRICDSENIRRTWNNSIISRIYYHCMYVFNFDQFLTALNNAFLTEFSLCSVVSVPSNFVSVLFDETAQMTRSINILRKKLYTYLCTVHHLAKKSQLFIPILLTTQESLDSHFVGDNHCVVIYMKKRPKKVTASTYSQIVRSLYAVYTSIFMHGKTTSSVLTPRFNSATKSKLLTNSKDGTSSVSVECTPKKSCAIKSSSYRNLSTPRYKKNLPSHTSDLSETPKRNNFKTQIVPDSATDSKDLEFVRITRSRSLSQSLKEKNANFQNLLKVPDNVKNPDITLKKQRKQSSTPQKFHLTTSIKSDVKKGTEDSNIVDTNNILKQTDVNSSPTKTPQKISREAEDTNHLVQGLVCRFLSRLLSACIWKIQNYLTSDCSSWRSFVESTDLDLILNDLSTDIICAEFLPTRILHACFSGNPTINKSDLQPLLLNLKKCSEVLHAKGLSVIEGIIPSKSIERAKMLAIAITNPAPVNAIYHTLANLKNVTPSPLFSGLNGTMSLIYYKFLKSALFYLRNAKRRISLEHLFMWLIKLRIDDIPCACLKCFQKLFFSTVHALVILGFLTKPKKTRSKNIMTLSKLTSNDESEELSEQSEPKKNQSSSRGSSKNELEDQNLKYIMNTDFYRNLKLLRCTSCII